jgi:hypothetical protein
MSAGSSTSCRLTSGVSISPRHRRDVHDRAPAVRQQPAGGGAHFAFFESPKDFAGALRDFLRL